MLIDLEKEIVDAISHPLDENTCFLCGSTLDHSTASREDVFPKWLQRELDLWDAEITLMNGSSIPYRQLKIPCCLSCNSGHLSRIENIVGKAIKSGISAVQKLPEFFLYQWMAKLYIGILYRELSLPLNRAQPNLRTIATAEDINNARILWYWLRQVLTKKNSNRAPGSVWLFQCLVPPQGRGEAFDFHDFHSPPVAGIRINDLGLIVDFLDCGLLKDELSHFMLDLQCLRLTPQQFIETFVRISYKAHLFGLNTTVRLVSTDDCEQKLLFRTRSTIPGDNVFELWKDQEYASFLAARMNIPIQDVMLPDGGVRSWIYAEGQKIIQYDYKQ